MVVVVAEPIGERWWAVTCGRAAAAAAARGLLSHTLADVDTPHSSLGGCKTAERVVVSELCTSLQVLASTNRSGGSFRLVFITASIAMAFWMRNPIAHSSTTQPPANVQAAGIADHTTQQQE